MYRPPIRNQYMPIISNLPQFLSPQGGQLKLVLDNIHDLNVSLLKAL